MDEPTALLAPLVEPGPELARAELARYARHLALPGIGVSGQRRLAAARVLVVGAGGLGSPALLYLAAAGVGTLGIVDDDVVESSNLQRQVIHGHEDLGETKTGSAARTVRSINPGATVVEHRERLTSRNALDVLDGYDLVLDGTDAFATRYLISDAAEVAGLPCVWGALHRFTGQVATFWAAPRPREGEVAPAGVTYRDVFPVPPPPGASPDCATAGVFGAVCGTIGTAMATEAIKLITGAGRSLLGRLVLHDALDATWRTLTLRPDPTREPVTELPADPDAYATFCGVAPGRTPDPAARRLTGRSAEPTTGRSTDMAADRVPGGPSPLPGTTAPGQGSVRAKDRLRTVDGMNATSDPGPAPDPRAADGDPAAPRTTHDLRAALARDADLRVLDVREDWEAAIDPFPGARLVPSGRFQEPGSADVVADIDAWAAGSDVHVICASGVRATHVAAILNDAAITAVVPVHSH